jgi:hypothetical protein
VQVPVTDNCRSNTLCYDFVQVSTFDRASLIFDHTIAPQQGEEKSKWIACEKGEGL